MRILRRQITPQDVVGGISGVLSAEVAKVYETVLRSIMRCVEAGRKAYSFNAYVTCVDSLPPKVREVARSLTLQIVTGVTGRQWDWATLRRLAQGGDLPFLLLEAIYGVAQTGATPPQQQQAQQYNASVHYN